MSWPRPKPAGRLTAAAGRVPLARRGIFADRRRAVLATCGVAAPLLLVLMLQGIFDGSIQQVTVYLRNSPADAFVAEKDVRTMHMSTSTLSPELPVEVADVSGVAWAEGIRFATTFLVTAGQDQQLSYVIGYDTATARGGPQSLTAGRSPGPGEIVLETVAADRLGVRRGDRVSVFGEPFVVSGLFEGGTSLVNTTSFITADDFARHRVDSFAYVLVGAEAGVSSEELADRLAGSLPAYTVQTRDSFVREESALVRDMGADVLQIMTIVGLSIALAVIGLTLFSLTLSRLRDYAVVKALGARNRRLAEVVLTQAAWTVALALGLATVAATGLGAVIEAADPSVTIAIEPESVVRLGAEALAIAALGALAPLRRVVGVDPASAFRSSS